MSIAELKKNMGEGDVVVLWAGREAVKPITLQKGEIFQNKWGAFRHDDMIGKPYGVKVRNISCVYDEIKSTKDKGWLYALFPTPEIWAKALSHRTQILYIVDISLISFHLELRPGSVVIESGTGSGALSTAIARSISPNGKLFTFEYNQNRAEAAVEDFKKNKLDHIISVTHRDVCKEGFQMTEVAHAVFLDLPSPWEVIPSAKDALFENGVLCSFSPCIEQVNRACDVMRDVQLVDIVTIECLLRPYEVRPVVLPSPNFESVEEPQGEEDNKESKEEKKSEEMEAEEMEAEAPSAKRRRTETKSSNPPKVPRGRLRATDLTNEGTVIGVKPFNIARGHTGFLTFARKAVAFSSDKK